MGDRSLKVTIGGDVGPLHNALRAGASSVNVFVKQVSSSSVAAGVALANIGTAAVSSAASIASSIGRAGVSFASWGVQLAAEAEQAEIAFGVMLGSTDKAKTLLADLAKFGAETPFELPGLRDAAKSLLAFGVPAEEMLPTLRAIGDVASGLNVPLGDLAEIFGKAKVAGRLMSDDINQLSGRGVPIISLLAKQFGVAEGEVKKLVESGQVGFEHLEQAFVSMTESGGQFAGMMDKQSQSLLGQWSTLSDGITAVAAQIGEALIEEFGFDDLIGQAGALLGFFQESILPGMRTVFRAIGQAVLGVTNYIRSLGADALELAADFTPAIEAARLMGKIVLRVWAGVQALAGDSAGAVKTAMQVAELEAMSAGAISDAMKQQADELRRPIQETWQEFLTNIKPEQIDAAPVDKKTLGEVAKERTPIDKPVAPPTIDGTAPVVRSVKAPDSGPAGLDVGGREAFAALQARERGTERQTDLAKQQLTELKTIAKAIVQPPRPAAVAPAVSSLL